MACECLSSCSLWHYDKASAVLWFIWFKISCPGLFRHISHITMWSWLASIFHFFLSVFIPICSIMIKFLWPSCFIIICTRMSKVLWSPDKLGLQESSFIYLFLLNLQGYLHVHALIQTPCSYLSAISMEQGITKDYRNVWPIKH